MVQLPLNTHTPPLFRPLFNNYRLPFAELFRCSAYERCEYCLAPHASIGNRFFTEMKKRSYYGATAAQHARIE